MRKRKAAYLTKHWGHPGSSSLRELLFHSEGGQQLARVPATAWDSGLREASLCSAFRRAFMLCELVYGGAQACTPVTCGEVRVHPQAAVLAAPLFETGNLSYIPLCAKLVAPNSLDSLSSLFSISPLSTGITGTCFTRVLGIWTQVSRLVWQALYLQAIHYPTLGQYP